MARLVAAAAVLLLLSAPGVAAGSELTDLLPGGGLVRTVADEIFAKANEVQDLAERTAAAAAGEASDPLGDAALAVPGGMGPVAPAVAVLLSLLAAAALGVVGGARFVTPAEVLENPVRQRIYAYLRERTGATLKQLTKDLELTTTNAIWHLRKLEDANLVHSRRFNGFKVFYPAEGGVHARRLSLSMTALQNGNAQEVFEYVLAHPGTHQREIARALSVNHGTVRWHLKKLRTAELLAEERRGKTSTYVATDIGRAALQTLRPAVPQAAAPAATPSA